MRPAALAALFFIAGCLGYLGLSFALFEMPASAEAAEHCGFLPSDFTSTGALAYERSQAWWISFQRKEEIFSLLSVGLASGFAGFALRVGQGGKGVLGGGLLALSAICVSCLAPVLSVVGLGMAASLLAGVPKSLIFLNTLLLTGWGALYLSRRSQRGCPLPTGRTLSNSPQEA